MAIEASIVEQLQELRKWQLEQQKELMRQQEEQRQMLSDEQNRMYQALSLSVEEMSLSEETLKELIERRKKEEEEANLIDFDTPEEECTTPTPNKSHSFSQYLSISNNNNSNNSYVNTPKAQLAVRDNKTDLSIDSNNSYNHRDYSSELSIDGMQSFYGKSHTQIPIDDIPVPSPKKDFNTLLEERLKDSEVVNNENKSKPVVKRPFLKKGQGLTRFMPHSNNNKNVKSVRPRSASLSATQVNSTKSSKKTNVDRCNSLPRSKKNDVLRKSISNLTSLNVAQQKLSLKNVPPPRKKTRTKAISPTALDKEKHLEIISDTNSSDLDIKTKRELEEVRIFELLEDKAENSSFCSTSSTVIAFLQQSTPLKHKALLHSAAKNKISFNEIGDQTLDEIVKLAKPNKPPQPQKCFKEPKMSQWDSVPITKLKNDKSITGTILPYGTDVDVNYGNCFSNQEQNQDENDESLHVRFSEYNEYKTMTDTSSISSDSQTIINYINDKGAWSDGSVTDSDVESIISSQLKSDDKKNDVQKMETSSFFNNDKDDSDEDETENFKSEVENEDENDDENNDDNDDETEEENEDEIKNTTLQENDAVVNQRSETASLFKSELIKTRLLELEQEIEIFRKESAALTLQRQKLQEERTKLQEERLNFQRGIRDKEEILEVEKRKTENILQEEKKRLAREKAALESRMKDAWEKAQKSKQERQEIHALKEQLEELKEELSQKESKWSATNARQRSQVRVLQTENARLKQELEKLQQKKNAKLRKPVTSNTRAIHQINKFLADRKKISPFKNNDVFEEVKTYNAEIHDNAETNYEVDIEQPVEEQSQEKVEKTKVIKTAESIARTRNLYESLLRDATENFREVPVGRRNLINQQIDAQEHMIENPIDDDENNYSIETVIDNNKNLPKSTSPKTSPVTQDGQVNNQDNRLNKGIKNTENKQGIREVYHPDGRIEYWYPNGNVKKVFPDKCITKMIYYNGDVRETDQNGTVKYFYAATRTWHTTMPDGLEILEFHDGQVERRSKDGTIEVSFPDGSVKVVQADGSEKWVMKDGTMAETTADGEKILTLPNGQREIHTKDHKRREYPDGTIKLVYPDGTQETRYANGRIRIKDKDGNLVMDTHQ